MAHMDRDSAGDHSNTDTTESNHHQTYSLTDGDPPLTAEETVGLDTREEADIVTNEPAGGTSHEELDRSGQDDNSEVKDYSPSKDDFKASVDSGGWENDPEVQRLLEYTGNWNNSTSPDVAQDGSAIYHDDICRPRGFDQPIAWSDPIEEPAHTIEYDGVRISCQDYPFLTAFLCKMRTTDELPCSTPYKLITYILNTIHEACYDFMRSHHPEQLLYTRIQSFDQIDIFDWIALIGGVRLQTTHQSGDSDWPAPSVNDLSGVSLSVGDVRHVAYHRLSYNTGIILLAICFLARLEDTTRVSDVELVLRMLYHDRLDATGKAYEPMSAGQRADADYLLNIDTRLHTTQQKMLSRIQSLLERELYRYVCQQKPGALLEKCWEEIELTKWDTNEYRRLMTDILDGGSAYYFSEWLRESVTLRNLASHPSNWSQQHVNSIAAAKHVLKYINRAETIPWVESLVAQAKQHMQTIEDDTINGYPEDAAGLRNLYTETHNAGIRYSDTIVGWRGRLNPHETNIHNLYKNGAQYFKDRYEEALKAEEGEQTSDHTEENHGVTEQERHTTAETEPPAIAVKGEATDEDISPNSPPESQPSTSHTRVHQDDTVGDTTSDGDPWDW